MRRRSVKYGTLKRTDHRLDMSPAGRNLFVSRDKQAQNRAARRIRLWMKVVLGLVIAAVVGAGVMLGVFYLAPWLRSEMTIDEGGSAAASSELPSAVSAAIPEYDSMGLPIYSDEVSLFVVNRDSPAYKGFSPELTEVGGVQVDSRIAGALRLLSSAAKEDGLALVFTEGYVSYEEQEKRFQAVVDELMEKEGLTTVMARAEAASREPEPGQSDFQSGMCVRLSGDPATFEDSRTCSWLRSNMGKYGFIFRYPKYKEDVTGMETDLTVIRYVGSECAAAMQQRSMCLEEYISYLDSQ